jgi:hypothetical protein
MAVKTFTTGELLTTSDTNTYLNNGGLVYVTSTTVGSAVSSVTISNCFSSTYDAYRIIIQGNTATNLDWLKLTLSGSTGSTYAHSIFGNVWGSAATTTTSVNNAASSYIGTHDTIHYSISLEIVDPFAAKQTSYYSQGASNAYYSSCQGRDSNAASSTGFTLTPNAGTISGGTIAVYGYRKA